MADTPPPIHLRPTRLLNRARARGPAEILTLGVERARAFVHSSDTLVFFVRGTAGAGEPERPDLIFREATAADSRRYARDIGSDSAATFRRRLRHEVRCFFVLSGDRLVHSSWVTTSAAWTREIACFVVPPNGDAYLYESFTSPDDRGRGVYPFALTRVLGTLAHEGIAEVWIGAEASNEGSLSSLAKAGFVEAFRVPFERRAGRLSRGRPQGPRAGVAPDILRPQGR